MSETFFALIGIAMIYSWIHMAVIGFKKLVGLTQYEKVVAWVALVTITLYVIGTLMA